NEINRERARHGRGERNQLPSIKGVVGEADEALATAAIVPFQSSGIAEDLLTSLKDRLVVDAVAVTVRIIRYVRTIEEARRRQLLRVTDHHDLSGAQHRTE